MLLTSASSITNPCTSTPPESDGSGRDDSLPNPSDRLRLELAASLPGWGSGREEEELELDELDVLFEIGEDALSCDSLSCAGATPCIYSSKARFPQVWWQQVTPCISTDWR